MGEALQWGKVCNGFSAPLQIFRGEGLQWGECLQYNTGRGIKCLIMYVSMYMYTVNVENYVWGLFSRF